MRTTDIERFFYGNNAVSGFENLELSTQSNKEFRTPPVLTENSPFRINLAELIPNRVKDIETSGKLVFHMVGDTGGINGTGAQQNVADQMTGQIKNASLSDQPSFFFHLGDVVYYHGENSSYHDQFYFPYQDYPAPIFAIPGNHDGNTVVPDETLRPFYKHFCSTEPTHPEEAGHSLRPTMTQPNCYWRLDAPLITILGLYSNVSGALDDPNIQDTPQQDWLTQQLQSSPRDKCLIIAVHHPLFSLGKHGNTELVYNAIVEAIKKGGRVPDAIFSGHDHNYQRFTWEYDEHQIPVVVAGAGGFATYDDISHVKFDGGLPDYVKLSAFNDKRPGFLRMTVSADELIGEYFTVPKPGREAIGPKLRDRWVYNLANSNID